MRNLLKWTICLALLIFGLQSCGGNGSSVSGKSGPFNEEGVIQYVHNQAVLKCGTNVHVNSVEFVNQEDGVVTYKWTAEFKNGINRFRQSGFIYLYENGDLRDFKKMGDAELIE